MTETEVTTGQAIANICALIAEFRQGLIEQGLDEQSVLALTLDFAHSLWGNLMKPIQ